MATLTKLKKGATVELVPVRQVRSKLLLSLLISFGSINIGCSSPAGDSIDSTAEIRTRTEQPNSRSSILAQADDTVRVTDTVSYSLDDGEELHKEFPDSFWIPSRSQRESLESDQLVKLVFRIIANEETETERMWVVIQRQTDGDYIGILDNDPYCTDEMKSGLEIRFQPRHVIEIFD